MDPSYKARKEAFVSNLSGSTIGDINAVTLVAPVPPQTYQSHWRIFLIAHNHILGIGTLMVCATIPSIILQSIWPCRAFDRFHPQCPGHPIRDNRLLVGTPSIKYPSHQPCGAVVFDSISPTPSPKSQTSPQEKCQR